MKNGGKEGEKGRNREAMKQAGEKEREGKRKTQSDTMLENRGKVVPLQPSKTHRYFLP